MAFFTNKHLIVAMLVTPVLAVLAWIGVDQWVGEKPHIAISGNTYPLKEEAGCRYVGGSCRLSNGELELELQQQGLGRFALHSSHPLEGVKIALVEVGQNDAKPLPMAVTGGEGRRWQALLGKPNPDQRIQLVARANGALYFAETAVTFTLAEE